MSSTTKVRATSPTLEWRGASGPIGKLCEIGPGAKTWGAASERGVGVLVLLGGLFLCESGAVAGTLEINASSSKRLGPDLPWSFLSGSLAGVARSINWRSPVALEWTDTHFGS